MNEWQEMALQMLPELQSEIETAENPMSLWFEIVYAFDEAYVDPKNDDFIERVYGYADWCLFQPQGETAEEHFPTCVAICFWEHIPTNNAARDDMPRWISYEDLILNEHFFKYSLSDQEFDDLKRVYAASNSSGQPAA
jgi:hypothetical protein